LRWHTRARELLQVELDFGPLMEPELKRKRFSEEQIIGILREHEAGMAVADLCRKNSMSSARLCEWKAKYGGLEVSVAKSLRSLEDKSGRLELRVAVVCTAKFAFVELIEKATTRVAADFLRHLVAAVP